MANAMQGKARQGKASLTARYKLNAVVTLYYLAPISVEKSAAQARWANGWADFLFFMATAIIPASLLAKSIMLMFLGFFLYALSFKLSMQAYYWATINRLKFK